MLFHNRLQRFIIIIIIIFLFATSAVAVSARTWNQCARRGQSIRNDFTAPHRRSRRRLPVTSKTKRTFVRTVRDFTYTWNWKTTTNIE